MIKSIFEYEPFGWEKENSPMYKKDIIIYGAGGGFNNYFFNFKDEYEFNVYKVIDNKFETPTEFYGIPANSLWDDNSSESEKQNSIIIITLGNKKQARKVYFDLYYRGFKNILFAKDLYPFQLPIIHPELKEKGFGYYLNHIDEITHSYQLLNDLRSELVFLAFMDTHLSKIPVRIKKDSSKDHYFFNKVKSFDRLIHCGASTGDVLKRLPKKIEALICFEPDKESFNTLKKYLSEESVARYADCFENAVSDKNEQKRFTVNGSYSTVSDTGDVIIECVTIDDALPNFQPTYITMDIEGSELNALKGAVKTLQKYKPDLAISVYHSVNDIWEIPLYLDSLNLGYRFYLRNYTGFCIDTVLYAISE